MSKGVSKQSPYVTIINWMYDGNIESDPPEEWIVNAINPMMMLQSFSMYGECTIFLNDLLNNFDIYSVDKLRFFTYLKGLIIRGNLSKSNRCFFRHLKEFENVNVIHPHVPQLKKWEVPIFMSNLENDPDFYDAFLQTIGLKTEKKKKITKKEKREYESIDVFTTDKKPTETDMLLNKDVITFDEWKGLFNG